MSSPPIIEPSGVADLSEIMPLVEAVGWPHRADDISAQLALGRPWRALDAESGRFLGVATWWPMEPDAGRVGLVIVAPWAQGRGIGRGLMDQLLNDAAGRSLVLLATDEGLPLYQKLGFRSIGQAQRHQGDCWQEPTDHQGIEAAKPADLAAIAAIDQEVLGLDRRPILQHLFDDSEVKVLRMAGEIAGYVMIRSFGRGRVLGPLVAPDEEQAQRLFEAAALPGILRVDRFVEDSLLGQKLTRSGLPGHEVCDIMVRGDPPVVGGRLKLFTMASHAWG